MRIVTKVTVSKRKNEWGEFVVRAYDQDGKRYPEADYHTDDKEDAINTGNAMIKREKSMERPLDGAQLWMVKQNIEYVKTEGLDAVVARLQAQGYNLVANKVKEEVEKRA